MTTSMSNMEEEIVLEAIVYYETFKISSGGDIYVGGKKRKHFKLCPNKSIGLVITLISTVVRTN